MHWKSEWRTRRNATSIWVRASWRGPWQKAACCSETSSSYLRASKPRQVPFNKLRLRLLWSGVEAQLLRRNLKSLSNKVSAEDGRPTLNHIYLLLRAEVTERRLVFLWRMRYHRRQQTMQPSADDTSSRCGLVAQWFKNTLCLFSFSLPPTFTTTQYVFFVVVVVCLGLFLAELLINDASKKKSFSPSLRISKNTSSLKTVAVLVDLFIFSPQKFPS